MILLILICFIITVCVFLTNYFWKKKNKQNKHEQYDQEKNHVQMIPNEPLLTEPNIAIIITMYSADEERTKLYRENIIKWIETGFPIFSVDSNSDTDKINIKASNYFPFSFKQENIGKNSSILECDSIRNLVNQYPFLNSYDMIFKVTGKYFLPDFKHMSRFFPVDADLIVQNNTQTWGQNCEIFGAKHKILLDIINHELLRENKTLENIIYNFSKNSKYKVYRMPPLKPYKKVKRAFGDILEYL